MAENKQAVVDGRAKRATMQSKIRVVNHWFNDSGDSEIVLVESVDKGLELMNDLFWFGGRQMPRWPRGSELTVAQTQTKRCYKWRTFTSAEADIPNDCHMSLD